jgi:hypothetical protein
MQDLEIVEDTDVRLVLRLCVKNGATSALSIGTFFAVLLTVGTLAPFAIVYDIPILDDAVIIFSITCIPLLATWGILRKRHVTFTLDGTAGEFIVDRTPFKESSTRPVRDLEKFEAANDATYSRVGRYGRHACDPTYYVEARVREEANSTREIIPFTLGISKILAETIAARLDAVLKKFRFLPPKE